MNKNILIVAGEVSSDLHAANLVKELKSLNPQLNFFGLGGIQMRQAGVNILYNLVDLAVVGFWEVLSNLSKFKKIFRQLLQEIDARKPAAAILVDYPGFNLRLAKELKKRNIPVIYYISPQIWAWAKNRINLMQQVVDKMLVLFQFEEQLYKTAGIDVAFVGHPLLDLVKPTMTKENFIKKYLLSDEQLTIAILPGSREKEIAYNLPIMLKSAQALSEKLPYVQFIILESPALNRSTYEKIINKIYSSVTLVENDTYNGIYSSDFAWVASGTATLETAILEKPMFIIYKVSFPTWLIAKFLVKIPYIGLVNVVAQKKIIHEYIQYSANPQKIAQDTFEFLKDKEKLETTRKDLSRIKERLGSPGATRRAAEVVNQFLETKI